MPEVVQLVLLLHTNNHGLDDGMIPADGKKMVGINGRMMVG